MNIQRVFAADRQPGYPIDDPSLTDQLHASWLNSQRLHLSCRAAIEAELHDSASVMPHVRCVAVSGSLGRMEVVNGSDCDLIVILTDAAIEDPELAKECFRTIDQAIQRVGMAASKPDGVFSRPNSQSRLCDNSTLGVVDEDMTVFGHRIQMLIDTQPVYGSAEFSSIQKAIVERYARQTIQLDPTKQWTYLLNDLIRYHRSLCVRTQWATRATPAKWRLLNLKLAHSRLVNYAGLLLLLGECSSISNNKIDWLFKRLALTPLERIHTVFHYHEADPKPILDSYNRFLTAMNNPKFLSQLSTNESGSLPDDHSSYQLLRDSSRPIISTLANFVISRPSTWNQRFFELLLF